MDWYDYMHRYEEASGKWYDLGGFAGQATLYSEDHKLLARMNNEQMYCMFKGLCEVGDSVLEIMSEEDISTAEQVLDRNCVNWKVADNNLSKVEYYCYIYQSLIEYELVI